MQVDDTWVTGEAAVNDFERICIQRKWPFVRVPGERDFGKDAYVDATDVDGVLTGDAFAVQIKGGESYRAKNGYRITVGGHRRYWQESVVPVIGVVQDPVDERLRWVNLTAALRQDPNQASVFVPADALIDESDQQVALIESVRASLRDRELVLPSGLGSRQTRDQIEAVYECFALAPRLPEALLAVRRAFLNLDWSARCAGVDVLALCTPHPDIFWTKETMLSPPVRDTVRASMRWTVHEVWQLLEHVDLEAGFERGSVGQTIYMLLAEDPDRVRTLLRAALVADDLDVAVWAAGLAVQDTEDDPVGLWRDIIARRPELLATEIGGQIDQLVGEHGHARIVE